MQWIGYSCQCDLRIKHWNHRRDHLVPVGAGHSEQKNEIQLFKNRYVLFFKKEDVPFELEFRLVLGPS